MSPVTVTDPSWSSDGVRFEISASGQSQALFLRAPGQPVRPSTDLFLPLAVLPAMRLVEPIRMPGAVSPRLVWGAEQAQRLFKAWYDDLSLVPIAADREAATAESGAGVGCFFSGGVDSFYALLSRREEVTHVLLVHGFDIALESVRLREQAAAAAREVALDLGKELIEVETNLRAFSDRYASWEDFHGAAMAAVALLLQPMFRKVLVATSHSHGDLSPYGTHPHLDPLWSTEAMAVEHVGYEADRPGRAATVADYPKAMKLLRVCWKNPDGAYNCGRCEKCLRTALGLQAAGALERCETLPSEIDPDALLELRLDRNTYGYALENLRALEAAGDDSPVVSALGICLARNRPNAGGDATGPDTAGYEEIERRLAFSIERGKASGRGRLASLTRRLLLRLLRPYTAHERKLDEALAAAIRELQAEVRALGDRVAMVERESISREPPGGERRRDSRPQP